MNKLYKKQELQELIDNNPGTIYIKYETTTISGGKYKVEITEEYNNVIELVDEHTYIRSGYPKQKHYIEIKEGITIKDEITKYTPEPIIHYETTIYLADGKHIEVAEKRLKATGKIKKEKLGKIYPKRK